MRNFRDAFPVVVGLVCVLFLTPDAAAQGCTIEPHGLTWWEQIIAWFSGDAPNISATIDPNG